MGIIDSYKKHSKPNEFLTTIVLYVDMYTYTKGKTMMLCVDKKNKERNYSRSLFCSFTFFQHIHDESPCYFIISVKVFVIKFM